MISAGFAADVADAQDEDAFGRHEDELLRADDLREQFAVFLEREAARNLEGGPELVVAACGDGVGGTQDDMAAERVLL